jgi:Ca-activated chloride channel homolog
VGKTVDRNFYELLSIPIDATQEEIRSAYRELALHIHPDKNQSPEAKEEFIQLQEAYEILSDPEQRKIYDKSLPPSFTTLPLSLKVLYSRSFIQKTAEPQVQYILLRLAQPGFDLSGLGIPLNICLVVDCSTSMKGELLDTVKATTIELIRQLKDEDIISIVSFADRAEIVVPASIHQDRLMLQASVRMLQAGGGTEIFQGLEAGYREVQRYQSKKHINHIILITDGRTYGDEESCMSLAEQASAKNIGISGLGIGGKWNDTFLDKLTSKTGGSSIFISRPQDVESFLKQKVASFGLSYGEQLEYEFELGEYVELRSAFRLQPDIAPIDVKAPLKLGRVLRNIPLDIILDFLINPGAEKRDEIALAEGRLYFNIPSRINPLATVRLDIRQPTKAGTDPLPPPQAIVQAISALTLYRIQERAQQDVQDGRFRDAARRLQSVATHLLARGEQDLARTVLHEAKYIQERHSFSEDGDKRIKYGTRALLLPSKI